MRWIWFALICFFKPKAWLIAELACTRQQLAVLLERQKQPPRFKNKHRRFWIVMCRWFPGWKDALRIVQPETVLRWHRNGWRAYWRLKSRRNAGRHRIACKLRTLIQRMTKENPTWGQQRIEAELLGLGYHISPRTVAKYMRRYHRRPPSPKWRDFLKQHAKAIWACDFLTVHTLTFQTLYVFFLIHHSNREVVYARVTKTPTAFWTGQQVLQACWEHDQPRYLIRDNDKIYGDEFNRRVNSLNIEQIRIPFRCPKANSIAERFVGTLRREALDHMFVFNERHLQKVVDEFVVYYNQHRPHRSLNQRSPLNAANDPPASPLNGEIVAEPVLGGLHHVYRRAA